VRIHSNALYDVVRGANSRCNVVYAISSILYVYMTYLDVSESITRFEFEVMRCMTYLDVSARITPCEVAEMRCMTYLDVSVRITR
jgi:hypothetical protein